MPIAVKECSSCKSLIQAKPKKQPQKIKSKNTSRLRGYIKKYVSTIYTVYKSVEMVVKKMVANSGQWLNPANFQNQFSKCIGPKNDSFLRKKRFFI